jgi:hypothetical protein
MSGSGTSPKCHLRRAMTACGAQADFGRSARRPRAHALRTGSRGVRFLVCDEGAFITGSTLSINGGLYMY